MPRSGASFTVQAQLPSWMWSPGPHQHLWNILASCVVQIPGVLTGRTLTCVLYIYIHIICLFFFKVKVAVPLSSLRTLLPSCSSVVNAGAFWQKFGLQQTENLRSTQDAALGLFPLHTHPQLCCEVSLRGDVLPVAGFCI